MFFDIICENIRTSNYKSSLIFLKIKELLNYGLIAA